LSPTRGSKRRSGKWSRSGRKGRPSEPSPRLCRRRATSPGSRTGLSRQDTGPAPSGRPSLARFARRMRSRSASAKAAAIVRNSFDKPLPAMSPPRSRRWSLTPRSLRSSTTWSASRALRNRRSSFGAMTMSPRSSFANRVPPAGRSW